MAAKKIPANDVIGLVLVPVHAGRGANGACSCVYVQTLSNN